MRWLRWLARKIWLLAIVLIIGLALVVQTGRILSPQVEDYRPQISAWLSARLGAPVQMRQLSLRWQALEVALQVDGLRLGDEGQVQLGRGLFHLDLLASLWNRELVWKNLEVEDFRAELRHLERGGWQIEGFPRASQAAAQAGKGEMRLGDPARIFQLGPKVQVRNAQIGLQLADGQAAQLKLPEIQLENSEEFHRLSARASVSGAAENLRAGEETLRLVLEGWGNPRDTEQFALKGYVQLNELLLDQDLAALLNQLSGLPEKYHWAGRKLARGNLWLESDARQGYRLRGQLHLAQAGESQELSQVEPGEVEPGEVQQAQSDQPAAAESALASLLSLSADISGHWLPTENWQLALQNAHLSWRDLEIPVLNLLARGGDADGLQLALDRADLGAWNQLLAALQLVPEKVDEWLQALAPQGQLENIRFARSDDGNFTLAANLRDFSASAHLGAPAVSGVNGYVQLDKRGGRVELDSVSGLSAHFPQLYAQAVQFQSVLGTVAWAVNPQDNSVQVYSGPLQLKGELGDISGQFLLELPYRAHSRAADFTLALGLRDAAAASQRVMVPETVSEDLRDWLNRSLGEKNPGRVTRAGFIYRGSSYREGERAELLELGQHAERQTVQLLADVADGRLNYAPGWPAAQQIQARLLVNDQSVLVNAREARLWGIDARDIEVGVTPSTTGRGSLLGVRAQLSGPAADGLKLLRESPLREHLGSTFDSWKLQGQIHGSLTLAQPLGGASLPARQTIALELGAGSLELQNLKLELDGLEGQVRYDSNSGLQGTRLRGDLWGQPLTASIEHLGAGEQRDTQVVVKGRNTAAAVRRWSGRPELDWLQGEFDYSALVTIPAKAKAKPYAAVLELTSDLRGVTADLPAPLHKKAEEQTHFVLRVPIGSEGNLYHLSYGEHLQGQFWQVGASLDRAAIALNSQAVLPAERGIDISGDLPRVDLTEWRKLLDGYRDAALGEEDEQAGPAAAADQSPMPITLDLSTDTLQFGNTGIDNIHVRGRGLGADWQLQFDSETASGQLSGVLNGSAPMQLNLQHLHLPAPEKKTEETGEAVDAEPRRDPWAGYDFASLPLMDFSTESLRFGEEDFGRWSFRVRPSPQRLVVSDIRGTLRGMHIEGRGDSENKLGAQLMWLRDAEGADSSQFIGRLRGGNLAEVLQAWGQEPVIESESARFDTALRWDGSPARLGGDVLTGELKIDIREGRFLRASDNAGSALLRLLSLFNFDTWARRLRLDFSDLYQSGMAFDRVRGEVYFEGAGELLIAVPIQVEGPTSELQMAGRVNFAREDLNLTLVATLPVSNNLALVAALAGGLPAAAGVYLISKAFKKQVHKVASVSYRISGDWSDPQVRFDKLFDDEGAKRQGTAAEQPGAPRESTEESAKPQNREQNQQEQGGQISEKPGTAPPDG